MEQCDDTMTTHNMSNSETTKPRCHSKHPLGAQCCLELGHFGVHQAAWYTESELEKQGHQTKDVFLGWEIAKGYMIGQGLQRTCKMLIEAGNRLRDELRETREALEYRRDVARQYKFVPERNSGLMEAHDWAERKRKADAAGAHEAMEKLHMQATDGGPNPHYRAPDEQPEPMTDEALIRRWQRAKKDQAYLSDYIVLGDEMVERLRTLAAEKKAAEERADRAEQATWHLDAQLAQEHAKRQRAADA